MTAGVAVAEGVSVGAGVDVAGGAGAGVGVDAARAVAVGAGVDVTGGGVAAVGASVAAGVTGMQATVSIARTNIMTATADDPEKVLIVNTLLPQNHHWLRSARWLEMPVSTWFSVDRSGKRKEANWAGDQ